MQTYLHARDFFIIEELVRTFFESVFHVHMFGILQVLHFLRGLVQPRGRPRQLVAVVGRSRKRRYNTFPISRKKPPIEWCTSSPFIYIIMIRVRISMSFAFCSDCPNEILSKRKVHNIIPTSRNYKVKLLFCIFRNFLKHFSGYLNNFF